MQASLPLYRHPSITMLLEGEGTNEAPLWERLDTAFMAHSVADQNTAQTSIAIAFNALHLRGGPISAIGPHDAVLRSLVEENLASIYSYVASPQRFCAPVVVVIDYAQPYAGMVTCEEVSSVPSKKIWYTGSANSLSGIKALNQRWIDRFVCSDEEDSLDQLQSAIALLREEYFKDRSHELSKIVSDKERYSFLMDPDFMRLVDDISDKYGFVEHYLFRAPSGLLFFDGDANPTLMAVHTEEGMARQFEMARQLSAPPDVLQDIFECRAMPFCLESFGARAVYDIDQLGSNCRPASICHGAVDYYWALFDLPPEFRMATPFSHAQFMRNFSAVG